MKTHAKVGSPTNSLRIVLAILLLVTAWLSVAPPEAKAVGNYDNAKIADIALTKLGQYGGQCKVFANNMVSQASGGTQWPAPGYHSGFQNAGGVEVSSANATKGDIIQVGDTVNEIGGALHTAIIVSNNGGGNFTVVDSNWGWDGVVSKHSFNPYTWGTGSVIKIWRMGKVTNTPADSDNDDVSDPDDWCPDVVGIIYNNGCPQQNPRKLVADFNEDGKSDIAAFFDYDGNHTALFTWNGRSDDLFDQPVKRWEALSGWNALRIIPVGTGDFDGDGHQDIAAFYNYGNNELGVFVWYGDGDGGFNLAPRSWYTSSGWSGARVIPAGAADFNQDGRTDIAMFFNYGGSHTALFTLGGQTNRTFGADVKRWEALSGWNALRLSVGVTGDFNGDGHQDVAAFFNYGGGESGVFVWRGNGDGSIASPVQSWHVASGWNGARIIPAGAADFNGDGKTDLAAFYRYDGTQTAMFTWNGRSDGLFDAHVKRWEVLSGWNAARISPLGTGDFNGDGHQDVAAFFDYGSNSSGAFVWKGGGNGGIAIPIRTWFVSSGWSGARLIP